MLHWLKSCISGVASIFGSFPLASSSTGSPLPQNAHVQLYDLRKRLVIIGDVHGCLDELKELLNKVNYTPETTRVILVGDMMAKGPFNREVVQFVRENEFMSVRGNHEDNALLARHQPKSKHAKRKSDYALSEDEMKFIQELPVSISIPLLNLVIVHAGLDPTKKGWPVYNHEFSDLIRIRCVDTQGRTTKEGPSPGERKLWAPMYTGPPFVVFGHDAKRRLQVHPWARGIDTGCVYGGSLSALVIESFDHDWMNTAEIISVPALRVYAENKDD